MRPSSNTGRIIEKKTDSEWHAGASATPYKFGSNPECTAFVILKRIEIARTADVHAFVQLHTR